VFVVRFPVPNGGVAPENAKLMKLFELDPLRIFDGTPRAAARIGFSVPPSKVPDKTPFPVYAPPAISNVKVTFAPVSNEPEYSVVATAPSAVPVTEIEPPP